MLRGKLRPARPPPGRCKSATLQQRLRHAHCLHRTVVAEQRDKRVEHRLIPSVPNPRGAHRLKEYCAFRKEGRTKHGNRSLSE
jgi:hypothetical protein